MTRTFRPAGVGLTVFGTFVLAFFLACEARSEEPKPTPVDGAWKLVERKIGGALDYEKLPESVQMTKYVTGGRYVWTVVRDGRVLSAAGGTYAVDGDKYTENVEYIHGQGQAPMVGKSFEFTWKIDGNTWHHKGVIKINNQDFNIDEKWERCK